jgi:hypothetical protein
MMNRRAGIRRLLLGAALFALGGCMPTDDPGGLGIVYGRVVAADGLTPVPATSVYLEANGAGSAVLSDISGDFRFENVPPGQHIIHAEKGNFKATVTMDVKGGQSNLAPNVELEALGKLAYVDGLYDSIEELVKKLGYLPDQLSLADLSDAAKLAQYRMIFLNCGSNIPEGAAPTLMAWVQAGGTLYASDWELDIVQAMFPDDILTVGSGPSQNVTGDVVDQGLQAFTGRTKVAIAYDLSAWKTLSQISNVPAVLVRGTVATDLSGSQNQALAISFTVGSGRVVYTTFHNEAGVTIDQLAVLRYFIYY